jgi:hypothetical protein
VRDSHGCEYEEGPLTATTSNPCGSPRTYRAEVTYTEGRRPRRFLWPKRYRAWVVTSPDLPNSTVLSDSLAEAKAMFFEHIRFMTDFPGPLIVTGFDSAKTEVLERPQ